MGQEKRPVLKCSGSGSSGNCYALISKYGKILLLDCGVPVKDVRQMIDWRISDVNGCLPTHVHIDHLRPKTADDLSLMGVYVWKAFEGEKRSHKYIGDFDVYSFDVEHDGTENRGFLIMFDDRVVLYITDAEYVKYNFKNYHPDTIIIECNYQEEYVDMEEQKTAHVFRGHMSLNTCIEFLKANQTDNLRSVILCHLSKGNADAQECLDAVKNALGIETVHVAEKGLEIELR